MPKLGLGRVPRYNTKSMISNRKKELLNWICSVKVVVKKMKTQATDWVKNIYKSYRHI